MRIDLRLASLISTLAHHACTIAHDTKLWMSLAKIFQAPLIVGKDALKKEETEVVFGSLLPFVAKFATDFYNKGMQWCQSSLKVCNSTCAMPLPPTLLRAPPPPPPHPPPPPPPPPPKNKQTNKQTNNKNKTKQTTNNKQQQQTKIKQKPKTTTANTYPFPLPLPPSPSSNPRILSS